MWNVASAVWTLDTRFDEAAALEYSAKDARVLVFSPR